ncbi:MAG: nitrous oxide-stimulated promoter family protein [Spirochaetia bacterium]|nr:nitrous oxide-stimulated promoter family protein [Spirochaetia bacterium]
MSGSVIPGVPSDGGKTKESVEEKRRREEALLNEMIRLYCRKRHASRGGLCEECRELAAYAHERIERCPFTQTKTFCSACPVHCYRRQMREKIKAVMRFSGPRMLLRHPLWAIKHAAVTLREKRKQKKQKGGRL